MRRIRRAHPKALVTGQSILEATSTEATMQRRLRHDALQVTGLYFHDNDSRGNEIGFPDTFIGLPKQNILLVPELKSTRGLAEFWRYIERIEKEPELLVRNPKALKSQRQLRWIEFLRGQPSIVASIVGPDEMTGIQHVLAAELTARRHVL